MILDMLHNLIENKLKIISIIILNYLTSNLSIFRKNYESSKIQFHEISDNLQSKKAKHIEKMTISSIFQKPPPASIGPFDNPILCTQAMELEF